MKGSLFYGKVWRHRFRAACTFWLGWAEVEMGAEGDKEGNQNPRGKLQGNTAYRLGNWSASSLHCWKDRNGEKCLQCSGIMHKKEILSGMLVGTLKRSFISFCSFFLNLQFWDVPHKWTLRRIDCMGVGRNPSAGPGEHMMIRDWLSLHCLSPPTNVFLFQGRHMICFSFSPLSCIVFSHKLLLQSLTQKCNKTRRYIGTASSEIGAGVF